MILLLLLLLSGCARIPCEGVKFPAYHKVWSPIDTTCKDEKVFDEYGKLLSFKCATEERWEPMK